MDNDKKKIYAIATFILGLVLGYYYGLTRGYSKARTEIRSKLEDQKILEPVQKEMRVISGVIRSIGNSQFILESRLPFDPTLSDTEQKKVITKKVLISSNTEISVRTVEANPQQPKSDELFRPFTVKILKTDFKSLKVSEQVVVEAFEDIAFKESFEAKAIFKNSD